VKRRSAREEHRASEELSGTLERVCFVSPDTGWSVLELRTESGERVKAVGPARGVRVGEQIRCTGRWESDSRFGPQFRAASVLAAPPATLQGLEQYLASGVGSGVGAQTARKLVEFFGAALPGVLEQNPSYLESVEGIGPAKRERIVAAWNRHRGARETMLFLAEHGITGKRAAQLQRRYGAGTINVLREDPYRLIRDLPGVGFTRADAIARALGLSSDDPKRIAAGLQAMLAQQQQLGHCAVAEPLLIRKSAQLLRLDSEHTAAVLTQQLESRRLVRECFDSQPLIYTPALYEAEVGVAAHIRRLQRGALPWGALRVEAAIEAAGRLLGHTYSACQYEGLAQLLRQKVSVLTGGPGTGKTTLICSLLAILNPLLPSCALAAPLGRVARAISQATGQEAKTLHRLLMGGPGTPFQRNARNPLDARLVLVDETTLVDLELMHSLLEATPDHCALILIGDADQLPSVGPGQVLSDLIRCGSVPTVRLTKVHRQADNSNIIYNAHRLNRGLMPHVDPQREPDFEFVVENDPRRIPERVVDLACREFPQTHGFDPTREIQVLTPRRGGELGTVRLNERLQKLINPDPKQHLLVGNMRLGLGDRVMQQHNNRDLDVYNGDTGIIEVIDERRNSLAVRFYDQLVTYEPDQLDELVPAPAMTVHKAQGSEFPAVIIPAATEHYILLSRALFYTASTRGRRRVALVGEEKALRMALNEAGRDARTSGLCQRLQQVL
jgi:exodeoxyribonuclease V alpha subunit